MARTRIGISHNIDSVISDIDDVKDDLRHEVRKRVGAAMRVVWADAKQYVLNDPHTTGDLFSALQREQDTSGQELEFSVYTDAGIAPYAAVVEYGSGDRRERSGPDAIPFVPIGADEGRPAQYPFDSPDIKNISGFAYYIEQWMRAKGIQPDGDRTYRQSSLAIAKVINDRGTYAHPYLRPAWFDNELQVKKAARNAVRNAVR